MPPESSTGDRKRSSFIEAARRAQIIEAAIETVAEVGYARASLAQIAQRAQTSKSVISYHFEGKDELLEQVVTQTFEDGWAHIEPRLRAATTDAGRLRAHIEAEIAYWGAHPKRLAAMSDIILNHRTREGAPWFTESADEAIAVFVELLRNGQHSGEFRDFDARAMAVTVRGAIEGVLAQWATHPDLNLDTYAVELATTFDLATRGQPAENSRESPP